MALALAFSAINKMVQRIESLADNIAVRIQHSINLFQTFHVIATIG